MSPGPGVCCFAKLANPESPHDHLCAGPAPEPVKPPECICPFPRDKCPYCYTDCARCFSARETPMGKAREPSAALADAAALREQLAAMELREKQAWDEIHVQSARNQRLAEDLHAVTSPINRKLVADRDRLETALATAEALALTNGEARGRAERQLADANASCDDINAQAHRLLVEKQAAETERDELRGRVDGLFESIKHGTDDHQEWLANKISAHFGLCHCGHGEHEHGGPQNDCGAEPPRYRPRGDAG